MTSNQFTNIEVQQLRQMLAERLYGQGVGVAQGDLSSRKLSMCVELNQDLPQGGEAEAWILGDDAMAPVNTGQLISVANPLGPDLSVGDRIPVVWSKYRELKGKWVPASGGSNAADPGKNVPSQDCMCALLDLLEGNDHLADITTPEWDTLRGTCSCISSTDTFECLSCENDEAPVQADVVIAGAIAHPSSSDADVAEIVAWVNGTFTLTQGATLCSIEHTETFTTTGGNGYTLSLQVFYFGDAINGDKIRLIVRVSGQGIPGAFNWTEAIWDFDDSSARGEQKCMTDHAMTFVSQSFGPEGQEISFGSATANYDVP